MRNVWAVTRETFLQCARTRIIVLFVVLLMVCVPAIALKTEGDGTLKGRIQTFLAYSTSLTQLLLCLVTIFLITGAVTGDISHKYIFIVASKPVTRWQYVLGRWCGVVLLTTLLLTAAIGAIYGLAQYLRGTQTQMEQKASLSRAGPARRSADGSEEPPPDIDRLAVENEVFAARTTHRPDPFNIDKLLQRRMKQLTEEMGLDNLIRNQIRKKLQDEQPLKPSKQSPQPVVGPSPPDEAEVEKQFRNVTVRQKMMAKIEAGLRNQITEEIQLVRPGQSLLLTFSGLTVPPDNGPLLQIRYKIHSLNPEVRVVESTWVIKNLTPKTRYIQRISRSDSTETASSFMVDPHVVTSDGRLLVRYFNVPDPPVTVKIRPEEITLLQRVAGFEGNLLRAAILILLRLMFFAAIAMLFSVFLSFPIACLSCLMIFIISIMSAFLQDATRLPAGGPLSAFDYFSYYLIKGVFVCLPALAETSATTPLVDGVNIPWQTVARECLITFKQPLADSSRIWQRLGLKIETGMGLRTLLALAVGWLIFRRRELAGVN